MSSSTSYLHIHTGISATKEKQRHKPQGKSNRLSFSQRVKIPQPAAACCSQKKEIAARLSTNGQQAMKQRGGRRSPFAGLMTVRLMPMHAAGGATSWAALAALLLLSLPSTLSQGAQGVYYSTTRTVFELLMIKCFNLYAVFLSLFFVAATMCWGTFAAYSSRCNNFHSKTCLGHTRKDRCIR